MIFEAKVRQANEFTMTVEAENEAEAILAFAFARQGNDFPLTVIDEDFTPKASDYELMSIKAVVTQ